MPAVTAKLPFASNRHREICHSPYPPVRIPVMVPGSERNSKWHPVTLWTTPRAEGRQFVIAASPFIFLKWQLLITEGARTEIPPLDSNSQSEMVVGQAFEAMIALSTFTKVQPEIW